MLFLIFPWQVDVPQDRWPVMNWLIILATIAVFVLQVSEAVDTVSPAVGPADAPVAQSITSTMVLDGWGLRGLLGHMWLHAGLMHLLGNMWFLWLFGNAVCAKIGNLKYLLLYVTLGVVSGIAHLTLSSGAAVGASGAINGIVGVYLVLFFENAITCYYFVWVLFLFVLRQFTVSSFWMIGIWLFWDIVGAVRGASGVAYFAHLGGFGAGFALALYLCRKNWITMERYEKSLWQWWQQHQAGSRQTSLDAALRTARQETPSSAPTWPASVEPMSPTRPPESIPLLSLHEGRAPTPADGRRRVTCVCGKSLRLSPQYASQIVRCPHCQAEIAVGRDRPSTAQTDMVTPDDGFIHFACTCGKRMKVPSQYGGRSGKCPRCGARLRVPQVNR